MEVSFHVEMDNELIGNCEMFTELGEVVAMLSEVFNKHYSLI